MAKYKRTLTSNGKKISTENQVISFENPVYKNDRLAVNDTPEYNSVEYLLFETYDADCRFKINNEPDIHLVDAGTKYILQDIMIEKITILDGNVQYKYIGFAVK